MKEIVIKIPDYNLAKVHNGSIASAKILKAVRNGKVLPPGHGELKDAEVLKNSIDASDVDNSDAWDNVDSVCQIIDTIAPLVEADKGDDTSFVRGVGLI